MVVISREGDHISWDKMGRGGRLPSDTRAVINVAGYNILSPKFLAHSDPYFWNAVTTSRVDTTKYLARAITKMESPPKVFATISGVGYYPYSDTETYDESSPGGKGNFFAELCQDWEDASSLPPGHPTRRVILRSGVVMGPGGGIMSRIYLPFFLGLGGPIGYPGSQFMPFISLEDVVRMFMFAVEEDHVTGVLNAVAPQMITSRVFAQTVGRVMRRPAVIPVPDLAIQLLFGNERADVLLKSLRVVPKRTQELGYKYQFDNIHDTVRYGLGRL